MAPEAAVCAFLIKELEMATEKNTEGGKANAVKPDELGGPRGPKGPRDGFGLRHCRATLPNGQQCSCGHFTPGRVDVPDPQSPGSELCGTITSLNGRCGHSASEHESIN